MPLRDQVICGDSREVLAGMETASVDAIITDPPAGVSFMGLAFDGNRGGRDQWIAWLAGILREARRVLKPGAFALVWSLPRTSHWTGMALEDAGFELRDEISHLHGTPERPSQLLHIFGSGFPKSKSCLKPSHETWWYGQNPLSALDLCAIINARAGELEGELWKRVTSSAADTSPSHLTAAHTSLNIASLWRSTSDGLCEAMSTSTTETVSSLIIDLKILRSSLSRITPDYMVEAALGHDGPQSLVWSVDGLLSAASLKCSAIHALSVAGSAIDGEPTSHQGATAPARPAHEPIVLAKAPGPLQPLQIDATRVATGEYLGRPVGTPVNAYEWSKRPNPMAGQVTSEPSGRWPPNTLFSHVGGPDGCRPAGVRPVHGHGHYPARRGKGGLGTSGHSGQDGLDERVMDGEGVQSYLCVEGCAVKALDEQAGPRASGGYPPEGAQRSHVATYGVPNERGAQRFTSSTGTASRFFPTFAADGAPDPEDAVPFFYAAKASRAERNAGCAGLPAIYRGSTIRGNDDTPYWVRSHNPDPTVIAEYLKVWRERACLSKAEMDERLGTVTLYSWYEGRPQGTLLPTPEMWRKLKHILRFDHTHDHAMTDVRLREKAAPTFDDTEPGRNAHPTVKPLALGRWLTRLVAAPGSVVLDPFCGSGSLSAAAVLEGCHYIAIDRDESYCAIARARIAWAQQHRDGPLFAGAACDA